MIFYTNAFFHGRPALLVLPRCGQHGEGTTLLWGSCYPDAPDIYLSDEKLAKIWGAGERKWIFAEDTERDKVEAVLAGRLYPVQTIADKTLWTDRPLVSRERAPSEQISPPLLHDPGRDQGNEKAAIRAGSGVRDGSSGGACGSRRYIHR